MRPYLKDLAFNFMPNNKPKATVNSNGGMYFEPSRGLPAPIDSTIPPTSFTDKNLDPRLTPADPAQQIINPLAVPGTAITPLLNAPKQVSKGTGFTKPDPEGLTRT